MLIVVERTQGSRKTKQTYYMKEMVMLKVVQQNIILEMVIIGD